MISPGFHGYWFKNLFSFAPHFPSSFILSLFHSFHFTSFFKFLLFLSYLKFFLFPSFLPSFFVSFHPSFLSVSVSSNSVLSASRLLKRKPLFYFISRFRLHVQRGPTGLTPVPLDGLHSASRWCELLHNPIALLILFYGLNIWIQGSAMLSPAWPCVPPLPEHRAIRHCQDYICWHLFKAGQLLIIILPILLIILFISVLKTVKCWGIECLLRLFAYIYSDQIVLIDGLIRYKFD